MVGRPTIKGKRHFVKHTTDKGRSPEYPDCIFRDKGCKLPRVQCGHPGAKVIFTCYCRHMTAKNTGMIGFKNASPCPVDADL